MDTVQGKKMSVNSDGRILALEKWNMKTKNEETAPKPS